MSASYCIGSRSMINSSGTRTDRLLKPSLVLRLSDASNIVGSHSAMISQTKRVMIRHIWGQPKPAGTSSRGSVKHRYSTASLFGECSSMPDLVIGPVRPELQMTEIAASGTYEHQPMQAATRNSIEYCICRRDYNLENMRVFR